MSLDWNVSKCPGYTANDGKPSEEFLNWRDLMIYGTMRVDLGSVTEQNIDDWLVRVEVCRRFREAFGTRNGEKGIEDMWPDRRILEMFVGLRTNVISIPRKKWLKRVIDNVERDALRAMVSEKPAAKKG